MRKAAHGGNLELPSDAVEMPSRPEPERPARPWQAGRLLSLASFGDPRAFDACRGRWSSGEPQSVAPADSRLVSSTARPFATESQGWQKNTEDSCSCKISQSCPEPRPLNSEDLYQFWVRFERCKRPYDRAGTKTRIYTWGRSSPLEFELSGPAYLLSRLP